MTSPGSGGNDINLAALWVPVMPETSKLMPAMRSAGEKARQEFTQGFSHAGGGAGSPEEMGRQWGQQFMRSFNTTFAGMPVPQGVREFMGSLRKETALSDTELKKLNTTATKAFNEYETHAKKAAAAQAEVNRLTEYYNRKVSEGQGHKYAMTQQMIARETANVRTHTANATAAQTTYTDSMGRLNTATGKASMSSNLLAGAIGGGVGAAVTLGITAISGLTHAYFDLWGKGIKFAIDGVQTFANLVLETGQSYEELSNQLDLYTTASGDSLERLNQSAASVFGDMDSGGKEVGNTMAVLSQRLGMEASPALERLTYHVEELRGRFGQLDVENFSAGLVQFGVGGDKADESLAALTMQARNAATPLNDLVTMMKTAGPTLDAAGLSYEQAAKFVGEMSTRGTEARSMMTGLQTAQKEFSERGMTFAEGIQLTAEQLTEYKNTGNEVAAQQLSEKLFGSRRWADALAMAESFNDVIHAQPGAFSASVSSMDDLIDNTQTLGEKWEEVKRKAQEALRPLGAAALGALGTAMEKIKTYIDSNMPKITEKIRSLGNSFLDNLPGIQKFGSDMIRIMGAVADAVTLHIGTIMSMVGMFMQQASMMMNLVPAPMRALIPNFNELKDSLGNVGKSTADMGGEMAKLKLGDKANEIADWVEGLNIDVPALKDNWNGLIDDINSNQPKMVGTGLGASLLPPLGSTPNAPGAGAFPPLPGGPAVPGAPPGSAPGQNPLSIFGPSASTNPGGRVPDWDAIAVKESGGRWDLPYGDADSTGGLQIQQRTWDDFGGGAYAPSPYQATKEEQIKIAEKILAAQGPGAWAGGKNFVWKGQTGGTVPQGNSPFAPNSVDTVPIWAQGGEEVVNAESSAKWRWLIKLINADAFQGGGTVYDPTGAQVNTLAVAEAVSTLFPQIKTIGLYRGPDGPNEHSSGEAADVMTADANLGEYIKNYLLGNASSFGVKYVLWQQKQWNPDGTVSGMPDRGGTTANHYDHLHVRTNGGGWQQGNDPASTGLTTGKMPRGSTDVVSPIAANLYSGGGGGSRSYTAGGGGGLPGDPYGSTGSNPQFPGLPGQYGGYGAYGAQDWESQERNRQAVREAKQRADDMDYELGQKQKAIDELKAQLATAQAGEPDPLFPSHRMPADKEKIKSIQDQLDSATHDLAIATRERGDQTDEITQAERKATEDALKPPGGKGAAAQKEYTIPGMSQFAQLGSGLMKGVADSFGLGDVFGKPPWEWGITKLLAGGLNWGIGTANAWADQIGQGKTGLTGNTGVPLPGWEQGGTLGLSNLLGGMGNVMGVNNFGQITGPLGSNGQTQFPNVSTAPNVVADPSQGMPQPMGALGPAPGPAINGDYQPINVTNHGPTQSDYDTWKHAQNSRTEGAMGGLPK